MKAKKQKTRYGDMNEKETPILITKVADYSSDWKQKHNSQWYQKCLGAKLRNANCQRVRDFINGIKTINNISQDEMHITNAQSKGILDL